VACSATVACTAVGYSKNGITGLDASLAERWNGTSWSGESTPDPLGARATRLGGVACPSATSCSAVGFSTNSSGVDVTLAEHWNGTTWTIKTTPSISGAKGSVLTGISCPSASVCVAVGHYTYSAGVTVTLAEHWNGSAWSKQAVADPAGARSTELVGVACPSTTLCTAVGNYTTAAGITISLAERWVSNSWVRQSVADPTGARLSEMAGVACPSTTICTAVGHYTSSSGAMLTLAERWTDGSWIFDATPTPPAARSSDLSGAACASTTTCIAVGDDVDSSGLDVTLALRRL
jgi:hypothetical protein